MIIFPGKLAKGFTEYSAACKVCFCQEEKKKQTNPIHLAKHCLRKQELKCNSIVVTFFVYYHSDVKNLENFQLVEGVQEQVNAALLDYTMCNYPQQTDKFGQLLLRLPEIRAISMQAEEYLYYKHLNGDVPCNNLLIEMLHAKRA